MRGAAVLLALACAALAPGCAPVLVGAGAAGALSMSEDRRSSGAQLDDQSIEWRSSSRIGERFGSKVHVNVTSYNRNALLTGEVPDERTRGEIDKLVRLVPSVQATTNELVVAEPTSLGSRTTDSFVTSKIKTRFLDAAKFNALHVKVVTEAGVVYLLGVVTDKEADDAVEIARTTGGVRKVVKMFEPCKETDEVCRPAPPPPPQAKPSRPAR
ncbi:MAG TPA: BON domain-containing protein [Burkholderiales bacterium]